MTLSLPSYQITRLVTSDGEEVWVCLREPMTAEQLEGLKGKTMDEIREKVRRVRR